MTDDELQKLQRFLRPPDEAWQMANHIARILGERHHTARASIARLVYLCGLPFAQELLERTLDIQRKGGLWLPRQRRKRTAGGVYLHLARQALTPEQQQKVFVRQNPAFRRLQSRFLHRPAFDWEQRREIAREVWQQPGKAEEVRVHIVGRPGRYEKRQELVIVAMQHELDNYPDLAEDMPPLPDNPTLYTVYIPGKHWKRIENSLKNPTTMLSIEGIGAFDAGLGGMVVYAHTVKLRKAKKKKAEPAADDEGPQSTAQPETAPPPVANTRQPLPAAPPKAMTEEQAQEKLKELRRAEQLYRERIAALEAEPEDSRFGLETTRKLLAGVEKQIADLSK
jgi:hypothetical protein